MQLRDDVKLTGAGDEAARSARIETTAGLDP